MAEIDETLSSDTVLEILRQHDRDGKVQTSPRPGHIRIHHMSNDVTCAIENMGGTEAACKKLGVSLAELDRWIDELYVPEPFASEMKKHTGFFVRSLQHSPFYVFDGRKYWPHAPTPEELNHPLGICVYRKRLIPCATSRQRW
jgi:hypothetical protein